MIMCVLLCYPVSIHMSQVQATGPLVSTSGEFFILWQISLFFCSVVGLCFLALIMN